MNLLEISILFTTLIYLWFIGKQKSEGWLFGILSSLLSIVYFYQINLWGSLGLQVIYLILGVIGYLNWNVLNKSLLPRYALNKFNHITIVLLIGISTTLLYFIFTQLKILFYGTDILLAIGSLVATYLEIKKDKSCWWYWIVVNIGFAIFYAVMDMYAYAIIMLVYAVFSFWALVQWQNSNNSPNL